ncbi:hypothetical protein GLOTRDRAFT_69463 [Gloeophyllum trabeum ATCC 11539]|uniref:F-box domain-containing protein n=1 Tax=Gloeophyllum trabeum (strain ATCC 11539 / FP-39264 / Madison 617) TaxID=670483 RepID=S7S5D2_GLOTA|nr:uncharacterized protein GLOTRDRAFT_69463 [Gloeophyllum trabeum ATCC 11539]EPQ61174.1 hypothetical protein GLOTRDRAFT_69463 [Gloeophyllum trabeum ATCC 11539]
MSLLHGVLTDSIEKRKLGLSQNDDAHDSDDEYVNVMSSPGTPIAGSRPSSRPQSPAPGGRLQSRLSLGSQKPSSDPLRAFPTDVSQRIFSQLSIRDLARCSRVSRKWNKSQTLNYIWFQHYRKENFHDESLPPGKWTKRESKQNWRHIYAQTIPNRDPPPLGPLNPSSKRGSGYSTPSGYMTPKEFREEKWQAEAEAAERPSKVEMRELYKEMGGRKAKTKTKLGSAGGARNKGGLGDENEEL